MKEAQSKVYPQPGRLESGIADALTKEQIRPRMELSGESK